MPSAANESAACRRRALAFSLNSAALQDPPRLGCGQAARPDRWLWGRAWALPDQRSERWIGSPGITLWAEDCEPVQALQRAAGPGWEEMPLIRRAVWQAAATPDSKGPAGSSSFAQPHPPVPLRCRRDSPLGSRQWQRPPAELVSVVSARTLPLLLAAPRPTLRSLPSASA